MRKIKKCPEAQSYCLFAYIYILVSLIHNCSSQFGFQLQEMTA